MFMSIFIKSFNNTFRQIKSLISAIFKKVFEVIIAMQKKTVTKAVNLKLTMI